MLNAIDLFSGYGGITLALREYCRPIIYCEIERYAQGILLSNFDKGVLPFAPIWNDVTTLDGAKFTGLVDIVYGGFPCQDISVAGKGAGLEGKRSGLFSEIVRICKEASPKFIFLENVPAIRTRGAIEVQEALASIGYDSRWCTLSAAEIGSNHKRERWFCLATNTKRLELRDESGRSSRTLRESSTIFSNNGEKESVANPSGEKLQGLLQQPISNKLSIREPRESISFDNSGIFRAKHWEAEPQICRVVDGCPEWSHRIKALGNGVVPLQVKTAFEILMGVKI